MPLDITFDIYFVVDIVLCVAAAICFTIYFKRRSNLRSAIIYLLAIVIAVAVNYYSALTGRMVVASILTRYVIIFLMVIFAVVNQSALKAINARINRPFRTSVSGYTNTDEELSAAAHEIVKAAQNMSKSDTGALIIIAKDHISDYILNSGVRLDAKLSAGLLESIFNKKSPLHDGAVIIKENRIVASGCFMPLSQDTTISKDLGTRHRAAIGISEESNVLSIVVSEETGIISTVENGVIRRYITAEKLTEAIEAAYGIVSSPQTRSFLKRK